MPAPATSADPATSRFSRDLVVAGRQQITREWFAREAERYELFVSQLVVNEISSGDEEAVRERQTFILGIPLLGITDAQKEDMRKKQAEVQKEIQEKIEAHRKEAMDEVLGVLSPAQRNKLQSLVGKEFEFKPRSTTPSGKVPPTTKTGKQDE